MTHPRTVVSRAGLFVAALAVFSHGAVSSLGGTTPEGAPAPEKDTAQVKGIVVDRASGEFMEGVLLRLEGADGEEATDVTDGAGEFAFDVGAGDYLLHAEHLGYRDLETAVHPTGEDDVELVLAMVPEPVELDPVVTVSGPQVPADLRRFHERKLRGFGQHLSREDLERIDPFQTSEALAQIPSLQVETGGGGAGGQDRILFRGQCPPEVFVDGTRSAAGAHEVNELVSATDLYGVEVYGPSTAPAELSPRRPCGVVAIWTEPGGGPGDSFSLERSVVAFTVLGLFLAIY